MEVVKDLTPFLAKLEAEDLYFFVKFQVRKVLAVQDPRLTRQYTYKELPWGKIERVDHESVGTMEVQQTGRRRRTVKTGEVQIQTKPCWSFAVKDGRLQYQIGGFSWLIKNTLSRVFKARAVRKLRPDVLNQLKVYPNVVDLGSAPCESMSDGREPYTYMENRNVKTRGGDHTRVRVFFDFVEKREFCCIVEVDKESALGEEEMVALFKSINTEDDVGPAKQGEMRMVAIDRVKLTAEERKSLEETGWLPVSN